jgi:hypothetical protein
MSPWQQVLQMKMTARNDNYNRLRSDKLEVISTDTIDFAIMKAIADLKVPCPRADRINSLVKP